MKLIGNSLFARCVTNNGKYVSMCYAKKSNTTKKNDPYFRDLNQT